jgi:hypothetical protein
LVFSVIAAAGLVATGVGATTLVVTQVDATSETRSAQALPMENLAETQAAADSSRSVRKGQLLPDRALRQTDKGACLRVGGHWNATTKLCRNGSDWFGTKGFLAAAAAEGLIISVVAPNNAPVSN